MSSKGSNPDLKAIKIHPKLHKALKRERGADWAKPLKASMLDLFDAAGVLLLEADDATKESALRRARAGGVLQVAAPS